MQQSELYQAARNDAQRVDNIVLQLVHEGRRSLRDKGGCAPEAKKSKFGLSDDNRELYTPKGIRLARETAAFRALRIVRLTRTSRCFGRRSWKN